MDRRAPAPQRQRHYHRPVISFKEQGMRTKQQAESSDALLEMGPPGPVVVSLILVSINATNSPLTASFSFSNSQTRDRCLVFLGIRIGKHALLELIQLPNFQVSQITEHRNIADDCGAFSQQRMNQNTTLRIHRRLLTKIIRSIK